MGQCDSQMWGCVGESPGVPGSAWEHSCHMARTWDAVGAGRESFPPEARCTVLGGVVASVKEGSSSWFRAMRAVCSQQLFLLGPPHPPVCTVSVSPCLSWGLGPDVQAVWRRAGPLPAPGCGTSFRVPRKLPLPSQPTPRGTQKAVAKACDPQLWPPVCRPLGMTVGLSGQPWHERTRGCPSAGSSNSLRTRMND